MSNVYTELKSVLGLDKEEMKMEVIAYDPVTEMATLEKTNGDTVAIQSPFALTSGERVRVKDDKIISKAATFTEVQSSI